jgi:hypothetical protein
MRRNDVSLGKLVGEPNRLGIDDALATVENIKAASVIKAILTSFISTPHC